MRIGVYPGTFDPITLGHMDIIRRGAKLVDRLVIGVTTNITKSPMFDDEERLAMVRREVEDIDGDIRVVGFNSLLMDFAEREGATVIVRGLRAVADFEYEYQMAGMNQQLKNPRRSRCRRRADIRARTSPGRGLIPSPAIRSLSVQLFPARSRQRGAKQFLIEA